MNGNMGMHLEQTPSETACEVGRLNSAKFLLERDVDELQRSF
jgi:hypothetical protein